MEEYRDTKIPMLGDIAPEFHTVTTRGELHFPQNYHGSWVVLFSYYADFTPVCTTELMTFASMVNEFKTIGTELIGLSNDSIYSHIAWLRKMKEFSWKDLKHLEISFPVISDVTMDIAKRYGMLQNSSSKLQLVRAVFIIDPEGRIRAITFYPAAIGRNISEIKRTVMALQRADTEKVSTPANWQPEEDVILLPPSTCNAASERTEKVSDNMYSLDWFMSFQQSSGEVPAKQKEPEINAYPSVYQNRGRYRYRT
ncbi:MAG TPA: peroxiredoxin [Mobilitalea sp.]|nr:peroxiredoxin [Mobilitalea sp.]